MMTASLSLFTSTAAAANARHLSGIISKVDFSALEQVLSDPAQELGQIVVSGYASPDGTYTTNSRIARARANHLKNYLVSHYGLSSSMITVQTVNEDWQGVEDFIETSTDDQLPDRVAMLEVIRSNSTPDAKERTLRSSFPAGYRYLSQNCFPQLRRAAYSLDCTKKDEEPVAAYDEFNQESQEFGTNQESDFEFRTNRELTSEADNTADINNVYAEADNGISEFDNTNVEGEEKPVRQYAENTVPVEGLTVLRGSSQSSQKVQNDSLEVTETLVTDTVQGDALVSFLINETEMRSDLNSNKRDLDRISAILDNLLTNSNIRLQRVIISGYASPDGPYTRNVKLAEGRMAILKSFVKDRYNVPEELLMTKAVPEDWEGLERLVAAASIQDLPHRDAILSIIASNRKLDVKERLIRGYVKDFEYLKVYILPKLRRSEYYIQYYQDCRYTSSRLIHKPKPAEVVEPETVEEKKPFYLAARTNLLYDAALVPNIGLEFYLGKRWTLNADWFYTWLYSDSRHRYWQGYGGYLGLRKYFGAAAAENPLSGHHLGLYGLMLTYDVEWGGRGYQSPDWGFGGGLEYGYSLPIARRFNLDFSLGVGYQGGEYKEYLPLDGHYVWQSTHKRHWIGPTKAEISLKWLIGRGNYHKKYDKSVN